MSANTPGRAIVPGDFNRDPDSGVRRLTDRDEGMDAARMDDTTDHDRGRSRSARYQPALTTALWVAALCCITHPAWLAFVAAAVSAIVVGAAGAMATGRRGRRAALRRRILAIGRGAGGALASIGLALLLSGVLRSWLHLLMLDDVPAIELHRATTTVLAGGVWIWLTSKGVHAALGLGPIRLAARA